MQAFIDLLIFTNKYTNANECQKIGLFVVKTDMSNNSNIDVKYGQTCQGPKEI